MNPKTCHLIYKTVQVIDHAATGQMFRAYRKEAGYSLAFIAKRMGFSAMYLSDLEQGNRHWTDRKIARWVKAWEGLP